MTYQQILTECIDIHFPPSEIKPNIVKRWINTAEMQLWNAANWQFKRVAATNLSVVSGVATMPADWGMTHRLYDSSGGELVYVDPDAFEASYSVGQIPSGLGSAYTVINDQIYVGPKDTGTYKLAYERRYSHLNAASAAVVGTMTLPDDTPIWTSEYHYILIPWTMVIGGELADPAFFARGHIYSAANIYEQTRDAALEAMKSDLVRGEDEMQVWGGSERHQSQELWGTQGSWRR